MADIPKIYNLQWSIDIIAARLLVSHTIELVSDLHPEIVLKLMEIIGKEHKKSKMSDLRSGVPIH